MSTVLLDTSRITDWASFHLICKEVFGFPAFYGENMDAWIDCLSYLDEGDGMSRFHLNDGEKLTIEVEESKEFRRRLPDIYEAFEDAILFINQDYEDQGKNPLLVVKMR